VRLLVATRKHLAVGAAGSSIQHLISATLVLRFGATEHGIDIGFLLLGFCSL